MQRCGIFIFYDKEGIVGEYVTFLLESIKPYVNKLILLINGEVLLEEKEKLYKYADYIYERENIGLDAGAYKDFFQSYIDLSFLEELDELFMINNSFYGPFFSWKQIFQVMEDIDVDFWGLSRQEKTSYEECNQVIYVPEHLQSYFFCIKRNMFLHPCFIEFWKKLEYPLDLWDAVENYEYRFTMYFAKYGFSYTSWADIRNLKLEKKENTSSSNNYALITNLGFPILRRKLYDISRYLELRSCISYVKNNTTYPIGFIYDDVNRRENMKLINLFPPNKLLLFARKFENIYLYGHGKYAKNLASFFEDNGIKVKGYIVSNKKECIKDNIYCISDFRLTRDDGMIIALKKSNYLQIVEKLVQYEKSHIYILDYE